MMSAVDFKFIVKQPFSRGAIVRSDFPGFKEDYLAIHCLIKKLKPKTFMEIGTSTGLGTRIICNAMGERRSWKFWKRTPDSKVFSIDVPAGTDSSIIYPKKEDGHPDKAGKHCEFPYKQLFGDSRVFDFRPYYPLEGWFIDGKHSYDFVKADTKQALKARPKLIIWHDMQIPGVRKAVEGMVGHKRDYQLYNIRGTRIAFAVKL